MCLCFQAATMQKRNFNFRCVHKPGFLTVVASIMETSNNILLNVNVFCFLISGGKKRRSGVFDNGSKRVWVDMGQNSHPFFYKSVSRFCLSLTNGSKRVWVVGIYILFDNRVL
ncbi:hypothetical protein HanRHA438_Chr10g0450491 [Helianthus annuus]|nr:hypothetical protein HanRHA438_Chr10g0450491 [Helianthus annuus]